MDYLKTLGILSLGSRLKRLSDHLFSDVSIIYNEMGITLNPSYFPLINLIAKIGPMGIMQASEYLGISHTAVSKLANKMIQENYLIKQPHPTDKRASQLSLSKQSLVIIEQTKPVWKSLNKQLNYIDSMQSPSLLNAIDAFENSIQEQGLAQSVIQDLQKNHADIEIVNWKKNYKDDFRQLNLQWLNEEFNGQLTKSDKQAIEHPESYYLAQGGYLFFAKQSDKIIGCIAIKPLFKGHFEISKMAVNTENQGQGVGRLLLLNALNKARDLQVKTMSLETNSKLLRALTLYQNFGFTKQKHPQGKSSYQRADTYMELQLDVE
ncbi:MAG: bifunctional helix-turn-helix transcriptional regulator/GNAT family N-acetyltransferase [Psychromonas sp.]